MARIRVNPETLIQKSADLTVAAVGLRGLSDDVKNSAESAPSYDGQFGPLVSALGFSALISGKKRAESIADHSSDLVQRASAFLAADTSDSRVIATIPEILTSQLIWLRLLAALMGLTVAQLLLLLHLKASYALESERKRLNMVQESNKILFDKKIEAHFCLFMQNY